MTHPRSDVLRATALLVLSCLAWMGGGRAATAGTSGRHATDWSGHRASTWQVVPSPNAGQDVNDVVAVAAIADADVWTVGWRRNTSLVYQTLAQHFDGSAWHIVPTPNAGPSDNFLAGVAAVSSTDVWAVGRAFNGSANRTLAEHWDGSTWKVVPTPNGGQQNSALTAVATIASNDVWAVGSTNTLSTYRPLALHWNGSTWTATALSGPGLLLAAAQIASNDVWAVGETQPDGLTLTQHWNGTSWKVVPSPNGSGDNQLSGVAAISSSDVWAVGVKAEGTRTLAEHWTGSTWQIVPTPNPEPTNRGNSVLVAVTALGSSDVWAVGFTIDFPSGSLERTLSEHWNGTAWAAVPTPSPGSGNATLVGVSSLADGTVWAVGAKHVSSTPYDRTLTLRMTNA